MIINLSWIVFINSLFLEVEEIVKKTPGVSHLSWQWGRDRQQQAWHWTDSRPGWAWPGLTLPDCQSGVRISWDWFYPRLVLAWLCLASVYVSSILYVSAWTLVTSVYTTREAAAGVLQVSWHTPVTSKHVTIITIALVSMTIQVTSLSGQ